MRASSAPTAAAPAVDPDAVVVTEAVWSACTTNAPESVVSAPVPSSAVVVTFESVTATPAANETPPPAAPVCAVVVAESVEEAFTVRSCELVSVDPSESAACVVSVTRFNATDAPKPAPVTPAVALACESTTDVARSETSPLVGPSGGPAGVGAAEQRRADRIRRC